MAQTHAVNRSRYIDEQALYDYINVHKQHINADVSRDINILSGCIDDVISAATKYDNMSFISLTLYIVTSTL